MNGNRFQCGSLGSVPDFALAAGGIITGSVVDAVTTLPITDTWVDATMDSPLGYSSNAPVNNNGDYMIIGLPTGGYKVGANAPGYLPEFYKDHFFWQFADVVSVTAGAVTPNITFTLELPPPGGISGIVADAAGSPLPFADVWVEPYFGGPGRIDVQADDTGLYAITGLFSGTYRVGAGKPGYTSELYNNVVDWNAATPVTVTNFMVTGIDFFLDQGATITGTVVDAGTGLPIFDAWVSADRAYGAPFGAGASTDPQGFYAITGLPPGEYKLNANHALYIEEFFDNQPIWDTADIISVTNGTVVSNVNFSLDIGGMITGTVMNEAGTAPIKDAWVHADRISGIPFDRGAPTGPNGRYAITGLPDGNYIVGAVADRFDPEFYLNQTDWSLADPVPVTAGAPTGNITFTLKAEEGGQIYGRVVKPSGTGVPYAWIDAKTDDGLHDKGVEADQFGRFRLGGLVTGTWWLVAHPPGDPAFNKFSESIPRPVPVQFTSVITLSPPLTLTRINLVGRAMLPDGNPAMDAWAEVHTPNYSIHRGHGTTPQGYFGTSVPAGNYALEIYPPWDAPNLMKIGPVPVTVTNPSTVTYVGVFTFSRFTKHIEGRVVRGAGGTMVVPKTSTAPGVPNVDVNAWKRGTDKWAWDRTDVDGNFKMDVSPGEWEVMISAAPDTPADWIYPGRPKLVEFAPTITEETRVITFSVEPAGAKVTGQLVEPDGTPVIPWRAWIDVRRPDGVGNGTTVGAGGVFTVAAVEGNYHVWIGIDETAYPTFAAPVITDPIVITDFNQIVDLGVLTLTEKTAAIEGLVTRKSDGSGVGGIEVFAWQRDGGWASATTKPDGSYHIPVVPGQWEVDVAVPPDAKFVNLQPPARLSLKDGETKFADFELMEATGTIKGLLQDPNGVFLTDVDGWGYIRLGNSPEPIVDGPIENGQFTFNVPPGTYKVGVWLPPNSGYTVAGEADVTVLRGQTVSLIAQAKTPAEVAMLDLSTTEQRAAVQAGTTYTLTFTLLPNDAFIRGTFYLDTNKTQPAIGLEGMVFAWGGFGSGTWQAVPIDPDT
ncbi:MAG: carboxypeptidase regulatory-like domain-containing protein, partial [Anaerolineae bacterium]